MPIRAKVTLAFASVIALVLAATGSFLYLSFKSDLNDSLNQGLRTRASDVSALVKEADAGLSKSGSSQLSRGTDSLAQMLAPRGHVFDATPQAGRRPLLDTAELARAQHGTFRFDHPRAPPSNEPTRLLATPVSAQGQRLVVVVGSSLEDRDGALADLQKLLLIGGAAALLLSSAAGYGVAAAALRPVDSMRRRAATISGADPSKRLPVPAARDELQRLGETLNDMLSRLEGALEHERAFVSDASHELRTPLAILRTELELASGKSRSIEELQIALRSASDETDRLAQLAEDLLVLARSDQGRLPVHREHVRVADILDRVKSRFAERARSCARAVIVQAPDGLHVYADPLRLEQALSNMTDNALRHGRGTITLSATEEPDGARLEVADEGDGFPHDFRDRAFQRFTRADAARHGGGAGLGLAIVSAIAHSHGGATWASNGPGRGARVLVHIPRGISK